MSQWFCGSQWEVDINVLQNNIQKVIHWIRFRVSYTLSIDDIHSQSDVFDAIKETLMKDFQGHLSNCKNKPPLETFNFRIEKQYNQTSVHLKVS